MLLVTLLKAWIPAWQIVESSAWIRTSGSSIASGVIRPKSVLARVTS